MKTSRKFKLILALSLLFAGWIILAPFLAQSLIVEKPMEKADAILVLSGGSTFPERTQKAAELYKQGVSSKIFLTNDGEQGGWNQKEQRNPFFYEKARWELIAQGIPEEAIEVLPDVVENTQDEAVLFEKTARQRNLKNVLIVTSAYHTRRAFAAFEKVFGKAENSIELGIVSPLTGIQTPKPLFWWLRPKGWRFVAGEYLKIVYYWAYY